jgi:hypothetical protein
MTIKKLKVPQRYEAFIAAGPTGFKNAEHATVAEWRTARQLATKNALPSPVGSDELLRLARLMGIPDNVPLLPRPKTLARDW